MRYLLDTCVLLWALEGESSKIKEFIDVIKNESNDIAVSVVSYWEMAIKKSIGKLNYPDNIIEAIEQSGFSQLNLEYNHIAYLETLPLLHNDPFDRLLISQSLAEKRILLTVDEKILRYKI